MSDLEEGVEPKIASPEPKKKAEAENQRKY